MKGGLTKKVSIFKTLNVTKLAVWLGTIRVCVRVCQTPTGLDDELGTLVAGKQSHIHGAAFHISTVLVHNGIHLCMAHCGTEQLRWSPVNTRHCQVPLF